MPGKHSGREGTNNGWFKLHSSNPAIYSEKVVTLENHWKYIILSLSAVIICYYCFIIYHNILYLQRHEQSNASVCRVPIRHCQRPIVLQHPCCNPFRARQNVMLPVVPTNMFVRWELTRWYHPSYKLVYNPH
jgi:hypothetical protein